MDFRIIILLICVSLTFTQLTQSDISYIKNYILSNQNQQNGIFFENKEHSFKETRQSIESLLILNEKIPNQELICKTILNEKNVNYNIIKILFFLITFFNLENLLFDKNSFEDLYNSLKDL